MALIKEIAQQALTIGYLSAQAKQQIQVVIENTCDSEDIDALIVLKRAIVAGLVKEESSKQMVKASRNIPKSTSATNLNLAYQIAAELAATAALALTMPQNIHDQSLLST